MNLALRLHLQSLEQCSKQSAAFMAGVSVLAAVLWTVFASVLVLKSYVSQSLQSVLVIHAERVVV